MLDISEPMFFFFNIFSKLFLEFSSIDNGETARGRVLFGRWYLVAITRIMRSLKAHYLIAYIQKLTPYFLSYTLSKSALATLTITSAMKLAPYIRVNAISPGPTLKNKRQSESHFKKQWKSVLLKKQVDVENICETVKFLIKNDNITGEIINVDSGQRLAWLTPDIINVKE